MENNPLISVVMPVFNAVPFVEEAILSIFAQAYEPLEIIVVDDGSTDNSSLIIRKYQPRLHYHYQPNTGIAAARNAGISLATGEYLAFLDADDLWEPDKLQRQIAVFSARPATDVVFGQVEEFFDENMDEALKRRVRRRSTRMPAPTAPAMLIRRPVFDAVGFYNPDLTFTTEPDWYMRLLDLNPAIVMLPEIVYKRRIHSKNTTLTNQESMREEYLQSLRTGIIRRRKAQDANPKAERTH